MLLRKRYGFILCEADKHAYFGPGGKLVFSREEAVVFDDHDEYVHASKTSPGNWVPVRVLVYCNDEGNVVDVKPWEDEEPWDGD